MDRYIILKSNQTNLENGFHPVSPNIEPDFKRIDDLLFPYYTAYFRSFLTLAIMGGIIQICLLYITYRVAKIIRLKNMLILIMLIFMNLDITSKITLYALNADVYHQVLNGQKPINLGVILSTLVQLGPVAFFNTAILLNLDNWIFMYFKLGRLVDQMQGRPFDKKREQQIKNIIHGTIMLLIVTLYVLIGLITWMNVKYKKVSIKTLSNGSAFVCICSGIVFGITASMTNRRLRKHFNPFY